MDINPKYDDYYFPVKAPQEKKGHAGYLKEDEIAKVHQLRMLLEAEGYTERLDTLTLLRFLRARNWLVETPPNDPKKPQGAKEMFVESEKWRNEIKLDEILPDWSYPEKEKLSKYYVQFYHKTDKDGRPVYIETLGSINMTEMRKITTEDRMLLNLAVEYERVADPRLPACSHQAGYLLETCCTIMDLKGVGITTAPQAMGYLQNASKISQNNYPERLGKLYIINAPWGFSTVWSVIKGFLDPVTVDKIHVLGSGYKSELLKQVPAENLPKAFGGSCECAGGCSNSDAGPWQDPAHTRTPKWAQKKQGQALDNTGSEILVPGGEKAPEGAAGVDAITQPAAA